MPKETLQFDEYYDDIVPEEWADQFKHYGEPAEMQESYIGLEQLPPIAPAAEKTAEGFPYLSFALGGVAAAGCGIVAGKKFFNFLHHRRIVHAV